MYSRMLQISPNSEQSFFLFGPRGTGKTTWLKKNFPESLYLDLLDDYLHRRLIARPEELRQLIPPNYTNWIILDEIQKVPALLNEVHRLIENKHYKFILTGSSARSLHKKGVNLLAGRALTYNFHPLTCKELGDDFSLDYSLKFGQLPLAYTTNNPSKFLNSYLQTYLKEEIQQEGLTRSIGDFSRFLEIASFSQGSTLNISEIARDSQIKRKTVSGYFSILEDLLLAHQIPVFSKRSKRRLIKHRRFYFFDTGVFRTLRPQGTLDSTSEIDGAALETLFLQELIALNDYRNLKYKIYYWHTDKGKEVDFVLYGPKGFFAFEIKRKKNLQTKDFRGLKAFGKDYPEAKLFMVSFHNQQEYRRNITLVPFENMLKKLEQILQ